MMNRAKALLTLVTALGAFLAAGAAAADVAIIVHPGNANASLSEADFTRIYLGRKDTFPDGSRAVPVNLAADDAVRTDMEQNMLRKSPSQMKAYWTKLMFTGEGTPPEEVADTAAMLKRVSSDPNAIGYVDAAAVTGDVKVIAIE